MGLLQDDGGAWLTPGAIALAYLVFGSGWIVLSDWAVTTAFGLSALTVQAQLVKGLLFIAGSGLFIYWLVSRRDHLLSQRQQTIEEDRTEIQELESDVRESEQLLRTILGNIMETVLLTDEAGRFTYVCPSVSFIFGYGPEEVEEMGSIDALLGDEFPLDDLEGWDLVQNIEHEVVDADGETRTVLVTVKAVDIESGSVLYSIRDVSERKAQEDRFKAYVENSSDVFTVIDREQKVQYVSPSVERILGYEPGQLVGRDPFELVHPEDRGELREVFEDVAMSSADTTVSVQYRTRHASGSWVWTESRLTSPGKEGVGEFVINTRDVSDLREREGRLSVLDRVLRHNIRNKLNIVLGASESLKENLGAEELERLSLVEDATLDLLRLSEKARRFDTVIREGHTTAEPTDLVEIARRVVAEKRLEYPDVEFRTHFPDEAWVSAHEAFELALGELVDNAALHSNQESPTIDVEIEADDGTTTITVADSGPGIPDMDRQAVLRGEETPLEHGMNIGLWLVRWTIDNSDGTLSVEENAPEGTRVEARLPSADSAPAD